MFTKKTKKKVFITVISLLFFMLILVLIGMVGIGNSIGVHLFLFIIIVLSTFLLNKYATSYNIYYLVSISFLSLVILFFLATLPFSITIHWQLETFIMISSPILYITIMRPKQGWAVGIIISFLIILFHIFAASTVIPLETIKRTLITYLIMMLTGISCGLIGEYIGKRLRNKKNID